MPATKPQVEASDPRVNGLLGGVQWDETALTFSFPSDSLSFSDYRTSEPTNNFAGLSGDERDAVRKALGEFAGVSGLTFAEESGTGAKDAVLRFAKSDATGTAWAYSPTSVGKGGDVWFSNGGDIIGDARPGSYGWLAILHEIGHALGLKHPHEAKAGHPAMPADHDSLEYTVMSYHSFVGAKGMAYSNAENGYPQSLMMYDIAALQEMYGANYEFRGSDTEYRWNAKSGQLSIDGVAEPRPLGAKVFLTIWDGGGVDTYNFASYRKNLKIDLAPGAWTITAKSQLAKLGKGEVARGNIANALLHEGNPASLIENARGGSGNDKIRGNGADNTLTGGAGNDKLKGGAGVDIAIYSGKAGQYRLVEKANGSWVVTDQRKGGKDGTDRLSDIEILKFKDRKIVLDASTGKSAPQQAAPNEGGSGHVRTVDDSLLDAALIGRAEVARSAGYDVGALHLQAAPEAAAVPALLHDLHV